MLSTSMTFSLSYSFFFTFAGFIYVSSPNLIKMQFGSHGNLEQHGFVRNRFWSIDSSPPPPTVSCNKAFVDLIFKPSEEDLKIWPYRYTS